ncbi:MAG: isochorismate synthase [Kiritimatiellae bacterium]|nr:isochorismate synthase [Kiritimatiellia bacterium]MDW8458212.1 isochorismate synthase [Verrucomicrobiota bacterium]
MSTAAQAWMDARDRLLARAASARGPCRLRETVGEPVDLLDWLSAQQHRIRGYWLDRDGDLEVAAIGEALEIKGTVPGAFGPCVESARAALADADPDMRFYGGFRFGPWHPSDPAWRPFQAYRFIVPQVELVRRGDGAPELVCNVIGSGHGTDEAVSILRSLAPLPSAGVASSRPSVATRHDSPDRAGWIEMVGRALKEIRAGALQKIVLARRACFTLDRPADPFFLIRRIRDESGKCFLYAGVHGAGFAFIGASPERLFSRSGRQILSEALAGTRPRGTSPAEDAAAARALLGDPKERREHRLVVDGILESLKSLTTDLRAAEEPEILKLARVLHLLTPIEGRLADGVDDGQLLHALHPTPALGGQPRVAALDRIAQLEAFDRGWYGGPIGWISRDAAEFAVAIRCGLVSSSMLCLFAGAGIVEGSDPEREWAETESKLSGFLAMLGC